jgi:hypothetical protein
VNPKGGAAEVERLTGQCRELATALRTQAYNYGVLRSRDAKFLRAVAERLDGLAIEITECFASADIRGVRGGSWWAKRIFGFFVGSAAVVSGVTDGRDLVGMSGPDERSEEVFGTTVVNIANEGFGTACVVIDLPDDQLRPSNAEGVTPNEQQTYASGSIGGSAIGTQPIGGEMTGSAHVQLDDATVQATGEVLPPVNTTADGTNYNETGRAVKITSTVSSVDTHEQPDQRDVDVETTESGAWSGSTGVLHVEGRSGTFTGSSDEVQADGTEDYHRYGGSSDPAIYDRNSVAGRERTEREQSNDHHTSGRVGVTGPADVSREVTGPGASRGEEPREQSVELGLAVEHDEAQPVDATLAPPTVEADGQPDAGRTVQESATDEVRKRLDRNY